MRHKINYLLLFALLLVYGIFFSFVNIYFETNDDVAMMLFASGKYAGTCEPHLVFIHPLIGYVLGLLYHWNTFFPWYVALFFGLNFFATYLVIREIFLSGDSLLIKIFKTFLVVSLSLIVLQKLNFTTTAALVGVSGMVLMLSSDKIVEFILGFLLIILASALRFDVGLLVSIISFAFFYNQNTKKKLLLLSFLMVLMLFLVKISNKYMYNVTWGSYYSLNIQRGKVNDNPNLWMIDIKAEKEIGKEKYWLMKSFFLDPHTMVEADYLKILDILKKDGKTYDYRLIKYTDRVTIICYVFILILFTCLFIVCSEKKKRIIIILAFVLFTMSLVYVQTSAILKWRVLYAACLPMLILPVLIFKINKRFIIMGASLTVAIYSIYSMISFSNERNALTPISRNVYKQLIEGTDKQIIPFHSSWSMEAIPAFELNDLNWQNVAFSGWVAHTPVSKFHNFDELASNMFILATPEHINSTDYFRVYTNEAYGKHYIRRCEDSLMINGKVSHYLIAFE